MTKTTREELEKQIADIYDKTEELENNTALIRAIDDKLSEVSRLYDVIDATQGKADQLKQHISDLVSLSAILLPKFESEVKSISDNVDLLTMGMIGLIE